MAFDSDAADHDQQVRDTFDPSAYAYFNSAVHSSGADLDWIEDKLRQLGAGQLLDLGCGGGHVAYRAAPLVGQVTAFDLSAGMLDMVRQTAVANGWTNIATQQGAVEAMALADDSFDVVTSRFSAHHWGDFEQGLREAARVVRPGGSALFVDVASPGSPLADTFLQTMELVRDPSHVRDYSAAEWQAALVRAGFTVVETRGARIPIEFDPWIARTRCNPETVATLRALQAKMPKDLRQLFGVEADGSFQLPTLWIWARR